MVSVDIGMGLGLPGDHQPPLGYLCRWWFLWTQWKTPTTSCGRIAPGRSPTYSTWPLTSLPPR